MIKLKLLIIKKTIVKITKIQKFYFKLFIIINIKSMLLNQIIIKIFGFQLQILIKNFKNLEFKMDTILNKEIL